MFVLLSLDLSIPFFFFIPGSCENLINYNPNKINKTLNRLNKRISGIVKGYSRIKDEVL
jgi:hypothetical protein